MSTCQPAMERGGAYRGGGASGEALQKEEERSGGLSYADTSASERTYLLNDDDPHNNVTAYPGTAVNSGSSHHTRPAGYGSYQATNHPHPLPNPHPQHPETSEESEIREVQEGRFGRMRMDLSEWLGSISVPVYVLVMFFAVASWVDINGLWVEVPLLVNALPEGWNLPSYLVIIIQVANIGPLAYTIANRLAPSRVKEWPVVYIIIVIGALSCLLLAFFWDVTTIIGGNEHSTALLSLSMTLALVDCTSSVVFLPYMSVFKPQYMTAYFIGEGLSGLIPGLVGLAQGVGGDPICVNTSRVIHNDTTGENYTIWEVWPEYKDPNFSVEVFFFFLFILICISGMCFTFLNFAPFCKAETVSNIYSYDVKQDDSPLHQDDDGDTVSAGPYNKIELQVSTESDVDVRVESSNLQLTSTDSSWGAARDEDGRDRSKPRLSRSELATLLLITAWVNGLTNGVLPSIQSFSALPYSNLAYTLSVRLGTVANPLACLVALVVPGVSVGVVVVLTAAGSVLAAYQILLAAMSPAPPLHGEVMGEVLCIVTFVVLVGLFSYTKVAVASMLQAEGGRRALLWCGVLTQIGSFIGAISTFVLVNIFQVFVAVYPCT